MIEFKNVKGINSVILLENFYIIVAVGLKLNEAKAKTSYRK